MCTALPQVRAELAPPSLSRECLQWLGSFLCPHASDFHFIFKFATLGAAEVRNHPRTDSTKLYFIL